MIKSMKNLALAVCLLAAIPTASIQARNVPAIVVGSVLTTGGIVATTVTASTVANPIFLLLSSKKDNDKVNRHFLAGIAATVAGLCLLGYGASQA